MSNRYVKVELGLVYKGEILCLVLVKMSSAAIDYITVVLTLFMQFNLIKAGKVKRTSLL